MYYWLVGFELECMPLVVYTTAKKLRKLYDNRLATAARLRIQRFCKRSQIALWRGSTHIERLRLESVRSSVVCLLLGYSIMTAPTCLCPSSGLLVGETRDTILLASFNKRIE